ncbi:MAG TPA: secretion protein EccC, partial [Pseudonocardia sp.]|nr:secretion protein EccC [Pseudonocardia sp.]
MSTVVFRRPLREQGPAMPQGEVTLQEPPGLPEPARNDMSSTLMLVPMMLMMGGGALLYARPGSGPAPYIFGGVMVVAIVIMLVGNLLRNGIQRRQTVDSERRDYLRYLAQMRRQLRAVVAEQRASLLWRNPEPDRLWAVATGTRLWER